MPTEHNTRILKEVLDANAGYAADFGDKKDLALPPARGFAILTCMDARTSGNHRAAGTSRPPPFTTGYINRGPRFREMKTE